MKAGILLKKLRVERNISQSALSRGISSRTTLASYETQTNDIPFGTLVLYLDKMNVRLDEFQYFLDLEINEKHKLSAQLFEDFYSNRTINDKRLSEILQLYKSTDDMYYLALYMGIKGAIIKTSGNSIADFLNTHQQYVQVLKGHIGKVENWSAFELSILLNCLYIFDDDFILATSKRLIRDLNGYSQIRLFEKVLFTFLINAISHYLSLGKYKLAQNFVEQLGQHVKLSTQLYEKTILLYFQGILKYNGGRRIDGENDVKQAIQVFKTVADVKKAEQMERFFKNVRTTVENNN
ncbi:helix-turn-helix domain-containing protein [Paenibacillus sp. FSL M7-1455]|uniref:Rgg family transcriptional regulator n=1 Tax=Paenibacillus sp. FSL M7-1455 TaxID=2975316 RepID=UPI0030F8D46A